MEEDLYVRLGKRLNQNAATMPLIPETFEFLRDVFSEEQAELGAEFPLGAHTLTSLAKQLSRDEGKLERLLEDMADEGLIFIARRETGDKEYSLTPFVPGLFEFQHLKSEMNDKVKKRSRLMKKIEDAIDEKLESNYRKPAAGKKPFTPGLRTLAIAEQLPGDTSLASWEQITEIINQENSFAAGGCLCREMAKANGNPCKLTDAPQDSCIYFGKAADFMIDRHFAKRLSREGVFDLLEKCEKAGLVHNLNNFLENTGGDNIVLCNCCGCCCESFLRMKKFRGLSFVRGSNFVATVDKESCIGCGQCADRCQIGATGNEG